MNGTFTFCIETLLIINQGPQGPFFLPNHTPPIARQKKRGAFAPPSLQASDELIFLAHLQPREWKPHSPNARWRPLRNPPFHSNPSTLTAQRGGCYASGPTCLESIAPPASKQAIGNGKGKCGTVNTVRRRLPDPCYLLSLYKCFVSFPLLPLLSAPWRPLQWRLNPRADLPPTMVVEMASPGAQWPTASP